MNHFDRILQWQLLRGSHEFPGPDGGTCINEAAIVAAGFKYRSIKSAADCPPCFSRMLSTYAIMLNDTLPDYLRQSLMMPFVTRLAGTADSFKIERQRYDFIMLGSVRALLPVVLRGWQDDLAAEFESVIDYDHAIAVLKKNHTDILDKYRLRDVDLARDNVRVLVRELGIARDDSDMPAIYCLESGRDLALSLAIDHFRALDIHVASVALLEGACKIGKQPDAIEVPVAARRMEVARGMTGREAARCS